MGTSTVQSTGFAPADTLKRTPHGRFITWLTTPSKPAKKDTPIDFSSKSKTPTYRTAQEWHDSQKRYYDTVTGKYVYFDGEPEPVKKTLWQKIKGIFSKDKAEENANRYIYSPLGGE